MDIHMIVENREYKISREKIVNGPYSKLKKLVEKNSGVSKFSFDRPNTYFRPIFTYYQTGRLHFPSCVCPQAFKEELEFWNIRVDKLEKCCYIRMKTFISEQKNLEGFSKSFNTEEEILDRNRRATKIGRVCSKVWNILEHRNNTLLAKIYFAVSTLFVVTAVMSIAISTLPSIKFLHLEPYNRTVNHTDDIDDVHDQTTIGIPILTPIELPMCHENETLTQYCRNKCFLPSSEIEELDNERCQFLKKDLRSFCYRSYMKNQLNLNVRLCRHRQMNDMCKLCYTSLFSNEIMDQIYSTNCPIIMEDIKRECYNEGNKNALWTNKTKIFRSELNATGMARALQMHCTHDTELQLRCRDECFLSQAILPTNPSPQLSCKEKLDNLKSYCFAEYIDRKNTTYTSCIFSGDVVVNCKVCYTALSLIINESRLFECEQQIENVEKYCFDSLKGNMTINDLPGQALPTEHTETETTNKLTVTPTREKCNELQDDIKYTICLLDSHAFSPAADKFKCMRNLKSLIESCLLDALNYINTSPEFVILPCSPDECKDCLINPPSFEDKEDAAKCTSIASAILECYEDTTYLTTSNTTEFSLGKPDNISTEEFIVLRPPNNISTEEFTYTNSSYIDVNMSKEQKIAVLDAVFPELAQAKLITYYNMIVKELYIFVIIEYAVNIFFSIDLILRFITCPCWRYFFTSILNIVDMLVLLACYAKLVSFFVGSEVNDILLYLQIIRVLRLLRLTENLSAFKALAYSLKKACKDMIIMSMYIFIALMIFSNFIYFFEKNEDFPSIPDAWWWCIVTMTTVGYGDMYPKTVIGRVIAALCACTGVILFSMTIPVIVQTFISVYQYMSVFNTDNECEDLTVKESSLKKSLSNEENGLSNNMMNRNEENVSENYVEVLEGIEIKVFDFDQKEHTKMHRSM